MITQKMRRLAYTQQAVKIVSQLTLEEKVFLMSGNYSLADIVSDRLVKKRHYNFEPYFAGGNEARQIPAMRFVDGPRGVVCFEGKTTCFPVPMLRGATFNTDLEMRIGQAIGREVRACGGNLFGGVCINLPYHPGWGRSQETYGEDSFALGAFGKAAVKGVQSENVIACVKHYAFNSMENSRFRVNVLADERTEREVFLPHFKDCVDAGAGAVMSSYNAYHGELCGQHNYLLRKVLKDEWGFDGIVMSDFILGIRDTAAAANAGMDIEMSDTKMFGDRLVSAVREGAVEESVIDEAATRIVRTLIACEKGLETSKKSYPLQLLGCKEHLELAQTAAEEGMVLLKNEKAILPLDPAKIKNIAVFGHLAQQGNTGDRGSSLVHPAFVETPMDGVCKALPNATVVFCDGTDLTQAASTAKHSDAAVLVVGCNYNDEGEFFGGSEAMVIAQQLAKDSEKELIQKMFHQKTWVSAVDGDSDRAEERASKEGGDRIHGLGLTAKEIELIRTVSAENPRTVVVLIGGGTILMSEWIDAAPAVIMAFYPGQKGGTALGNILTGRVNPSGKLPFVVPVDEKDLPQMDWETNEQHYEYYHGYAKLDKEGVASLFPYGFGLSYTTFALSDAVFVSQADWLKASCRITNTGTSAGAQVVQLYVGFQNSQIDRPLKLLRGFSKIFLQPGETAIAEIDCPLNKLAYYQPETQTFELEHITYNLYLSVSQADEYSLSGSIIL